MNNWELENKLNNKVDKYELHSLKSEISNLERKIENQKAEIQSLRATNSNRYEIFEQLIVLLAERPEFADIQDNLYSLRRNL